MGIVVVILVIVVGAGWIAWRRRRYGQVSTVSVPTPDVSHKHLAYKSFMHGNTLLRAGKFDEANAAFHQTRVFEPNPEMLVRSYCSRRFAISQPPFKRPTMLLTCKVNHKVPLWSKTAV